ncbi:hypothetical protein TNIN_63411 [Trichonephila inaurata madagascariensis]|uniref:Uncharacterized protein n=1 Tax=Trichonephila inaurata madagascariensis TaxID=2747483 RepID=A0A8X6II38_9ARAC|nr:hypothetical protein TNIN_63411 [Trichonephila inaurata madagascariensis]
MKLSEEGERRTNKERRGRVQLSGNLLFTSGKKTISSEFSFPSETTVTSQDCLITSQEWMGTPKNHLFIAHRGWDWIDFIEATVEQMDLKVTIQS